MLRVVIDDQRLRRRLRLLRCFLCRGVGLLLCGISGAIVVGLGLNYGCRLQPRTQLLITRRALEIEQPNTRIPPVAADKSLITQAITRLLENAIKYSPERTSVTVSTLLEAEAVRVMVDDRGYGIPVESMDRIWEKFYRVARDGQEKDEESTGLGLAFVKEVVEQHGGSVTVESEVGRGSKFSLALPRQHRALFVPVF